MLEFLLKADSASSFNRNLLKAILCFTDQGYFLPANLRSVKEAQKAMKNWKSKTKILLEHLKQHLRTKHISPTKAVDLMNQKEAKEFIDGLIDREVFVKGVRAL